MRTVEQAFEFEGGSLQRIRAEEGDLFAEAIVCALVSDLLDDLNLAHTMTSRQVERAASLLVEEFKQLNPADFVLCFNSMRLGKYGETYHRIDIQVLSKCLNQYFIDRLEAAETKSIKQHIEAKHPMMLPEVVDKMEFYRRGKAFFDANSVDPEKQDEAEYQRFRAEYARKQSLEVKQLPPPDKKTAPTKRKPKDKPDISDAVVVDSVDGGKG